MKLDRNYLTSMILEVLNESSEDEETLQMVKDSFYTGDPEDANTAIEMLISLGLIAEPTASYITGSSAIFMVFNSSEELKQLISILNKLGIEPQKVDISVGQQKRPMYYKTDPERDGISEDAIILRL